MTAQRNAQATPQQAAATTAQQTAEAASSLPIAVITGGTRGIGAHLVRGFAAAGYPVALTSRTADTAQAAAGETASAADAPVAGFSLDTASDDSVRDFAASLAAWADEIGRPVGVLVNNAGVIEGAPFDAESPFDAAEIARVIDVDLIGPVRVIAALLPQLEAAAAQTGAPARIIDLNSGSGAQGTPAYPGYSAAKTGLFRIADALVAHRGETLRVFEMAPGVVASDMTHSMPMHDHRTGDDWTDPNAVTALALALASGEFDALTGRYVRAGADSPESLRALLEDHGGELPDGFRRLAVDM